MEIVSSDLEIMFQNAKLNTGAGISSSPLSFAILRGNAELNEVSFQLTAGFLCRAVREEASLAVCEFLLDFN